MPMMMATPDAEPPPNGKPPPIPPNSPITFMHDTLLSKSPVRTFFSTLLCIDVICTSQEFTDYPIKPFLRDFLQQLKNINNKNTILPIDTNSPLGCIAMDSNIPSGETLTKHQSSNQQKYNQR